MKRIAIVIDSLSGGGAEKVMLTLAEGLISLGHCVTIFALKAQIDYSINDKIKVVFPLKNYQKRIRGWANGKVLSALLKQSFLEQNGSNKPFDLTLINLYESYRIASLCDLPNSYYLIHNAYRQELLREIKMGPLKYVYMRNILKKLRGKRLIAVSQGVAQECSGSNLFTPLSVTQIYNPFDFEYIQTQALKSTHAPAPEHFILHIGRAAKAKRHDVLFKALSQIDTKYKLVCLSNNIKKLSKLALKWGVQERVVLPGFTQNPYAWMSKAKLVVLSSDFEGLPTVLIEALICSTSVVATNCPHGPNEILEGVLTPFLVPPNDPAALAEKVNQALQINCSNQQLASLPILQKVSLSVVSRQYEQLALRDEG